jgi:hypothetical protein
MINVAINKDLMSLARSPTMPLEYGGIWYERLPSLNLTDLRLSLVFSICLPCAVFTAITLVSRHQRACRTQTEARGAFGYARGQLIFPGTR